MYSRTHICLKKQNKAVVTFKEWKWEPGKIYFVFFYAI